MEIMSLEWVAVASIAAFGALAIFNIFDRVARKRRQDVADIESRLVRGLKEQVSLLNSELEKQSERLASMERKLEVLRIENSTLKEVLSNKDQESLEYRDKAMAAIAQVHEIANAVRDNHMLSTEIQKEIRDLYKSLNRHMDHIEKKGGESNDQRL